MPPAIGMVRIHAHTILFTTPHLMALNRLAVPTPMIAEEMLWVVETGIPRADAPRITDAALVSAAKPWIGCNFTSLWPSVLMTRQPPAAVPAAITSAQVILIHRSIPPSFRASSEGCRKPRNQGRLSSVPAASALIRVRATMPMVFWASFMPCAKPMIVSAASMGFAHGLLGVVHAMRKAHAGGGHDLALAEEPVDPARPDHAREHPAGPGEHGDDEEQHAHHQEAGAEAEHGRAHHRDDHLPQHDGAAPHRLGRLGP